MIKDEFKFIGKNKLILVSVLVIILIPFLYSIFFLKSVWDPYGDTQNLPVAVVNLDQPVTYQGKKLNVGEQTVNKLKNNKKLGWHFVSKAQADKGMKANKYYTVITLPKDFSKNAATILDEHPRKMDLKYQTNDSLNYIGQVISGIGLNALNSEIRANVTNAYASAVFDQIKTIGKGMKNAADAATQIDEGQVKLDDGIDQYTVAVSQVNDGIQTMKVKVSPMSSQIPQLASGANQVASGLQTLNGSTTQLASGVGQLANGSNQVTNGLGTLQSKTGTLSSGVGQLASGSNQVTSGLGTLQSKTGTLSSGVGQLATGSNQVTNGLGTLQTESGQLANGITQLQTGSASLTTGVKNYTDGVTSLSKGIDQLAGSTGSLATDTNSLATGSSDLTNGLQQLSGSVDSQNKQAVESAAKLQESLTKYEATLKAKTNQDPDLVAGFEQLETNINALMTQTESSGTSLSTTLNQKLIPGSKKVSDGLTTLNQRVPTLTAAITGLQNGATKIISNNDQLVTGTNSLNSGINQLATKAPSLVDGVSQLYSGSGQVSGGLNTLNGQIPTLTNGVSQLYSGSSQVSGGLTSLNGQIPTLTNGVSQLYSGSSQVSGGLSTLNGQVPTLTNGVSQLANGAGQVANGVGQLNANVPTLVSGVNQLADGTSQITAQSGTLKSGSTQLKNGDKKFAKTLSSSAKKVNGITVTSDTKKMFAAPTKMSHKHYSYVPNYGHALAPYVLSLALYVGALVFNFAYPIRKVSKADGTATQWFFSKITIGAVVAVATAIVEATLIMAVGLNVDHVGQFYLTAILFSLTSMYLIMFLSMAFDNPGRFLAMVGLMLQLGGSGGTFPMELTNQFYNIIHPFLPMSYSIMNFRNAITSGIASNTVTLGYIVIIAFALGSLLLLWITMILLQRYHKMGISQLDDNQKLQAVEK
ncbi:YhgE/Pip domain-containing protein [Lacticaseibacillus paracasei]|uniref:YhgE/Pip domain-containing protein n=1 Tax=Lacticaseibacillus paracasei TaxID=1597 RepID=UPI000E092B20|nr:YhgE/Pip domain-containing protein [Lacticaseibacillus paracasei]RDG19436.1 YhgE/Pip domain-containing protein [Lacticaseibacillus paracasei]